MCALLAAALVSAAHPAGVPVIEDDWPRALAEARTMDAPLFVDAWAPW